MRVYSVMVYLDVALTEDGSEPELAVAMDRVQAAVDGMGDGEGFSIDHRGYEPYYASAPTR